MDATAHDGTFVTLKRIDRTRHPQEVEITVFLSSPELSSDPRNHSVRVLDVLDDVPEEPDFAILVTPLLSNLEEPVVDTVGEFVAFYTQILEGLQFLHEHRVAHWYAPESTGPPSILTYFLPATSSRPIY